MGLVFSVIDQNFPPTAKWGVNDIPDLSYKVVIVTGATSGLGMETAKALLAHKAKVYIACRDATKAASTIEFLTKETGNSPIFLELDLANLDSVKRAAETFKREERALHILFNNAGVMCPPIGKVTKEGYDLQFGTNVLGHYYLTTLLLPVLKMGARDSPDHVARVINTSSQIHVIAKMNYDTFTDTAVRRKQDLNALYSQSKFGKIVFSNELARRYGKDGIMSLALHPVSQQTWEDIFRHLLDESFHSPPEGALTQLYGGTAPEAASLNGQYLIPWARIGKPHKGTLDQEEGQKLWKWLEEQVQKHEGKRSQ